MPTFYIPSVSEVSAETGIESVYARVYRWSMDKRLPQGELIPIVESEVWDLADAIKHYPCPKGSQSIEDWVDIIQSGRMALGGKRIVVL